MTQADKAQQFRTLHEAPNAFVIANVWDGGSARMMAGLGFAALATSSGASAGLLGRRDGRRWRVAGLLRLPAQHSGRPRSSAALETMHAPNRDCGIGCQDNHLLNFDPIGGQSPSYRLLL